MLRKKKPLDIGFIVCFFFCFFYLKGNSRTTTLSSVGVAIVVDGSGGGGGGAGGGDHDGTLDVFRMRTHAHQVFFTKHLLANNRKTFFFR